MYEEQYFNIADVLSDYTHCFREDDIAELISPEENCRTDLLNSVLNDPRFIFTHYGVDLRRLFISKRTLYRWYVNLNTRLARIKESKLSKRQLALTLSSLLLNDRFDSPPKEYIDFAKQFGLVCFIDDETEYGFPLAYILSFMAATIIRGVQEFLLNNPLYDLGMNSCTQETIAQSVRDSLSRLTPKECDIIAKREGLLGNRNMTLEEVGQSLEITRERVRQIESKIWKKMNNPDSKLRLNIAIALVLYIASRQGSIIISQDSFSPEMKFAAECLGVPCSRLARTHLWIFKEFTGGVPALQGNYEVIHDIEALANALTSGFPGLFIQDDYVTLARALAPVLLKQLTKSQKAYLALKLIGKPAHYSKVIEVYNSMFPDEPATERNIHAVLSREEYGVVWIGVRGTFALKEWGYEHPSATLFDTVAEIVRKRFNETNKPVPFGIVIAEIGKYRQIVLPSSLTIATYCNSSLQCISKDSFVPKSPAEEIQEDIPASELDRILKEFELDKGQ